MVADGNIASCPYWHENCVVPLFQCNRCNFRVLSVSQKNRWVTCENPRDAIKIYVKALPLFISDRNVTKVTRADVIIRLCQTLWTLWRYNTVSILSYKFCNLILICKYKLSLTLSVTTCRLMRPRATVVTNRADMKRGEVWTWIPMASRGFSLATYRFVAIGKHRIKASMVFPCSIRRFGHSNYSRKIRYFPANSKWKKIQNSNSKLLCKIDFITFSVIRISNILFLKKKLFFDTHLVWPSTR